MILNEVVSKVAITLPSPGLPGIAHWLAARAMMTADDTAQASNRLFHQMLASSDASERVAAEGAIAWDGNLAHVTRWLATQVLSAPKRAPGVKAAKVCLLHLLARGTDHEKKAVVNSLIWMVLHSRPAKRLSPNQRSARIPRTHADGTDWAALLLDKDVIRPLLNAGRWWDRCRLAETKFGFDFADEGINFIWERIEKYQIGEGDFRGWLETVLGNYWNSLHRKWKRTVPKNSDAAEELESLADGEDEIWKKVAKVAANEQRRESSKSGTNTYTSYSGPDAFFSPSDLAVMSRWEPIDGVLMGFETDLWERIPRIIWEGWLKRLKITRWMFGGAIGGMKPPERRELLAKITGVKGNTLAQRWKRLKPKLGALECIRIVRTAADDHR